MTQDQSYQWDYTKCRIKTTAKLRAADNSGWQLKEGELSGFGFLVDGGYWFRFPNEVMFPVVSVSGPNHLQLIRPGEGVLVDLPYAVPFQTPLYWKDEQSGMLSGAVKSFINCMATDD